MKKKIKYAFISAFSTGIAAAYVFFVPLNSTLHDAIPLIAGGVVLGSLVTAYLFLQELKRLKRSSDFLAKDVVRLAEEKRRANYLAATYLTEKNAVEQQLNELKNIRTEIKEVVIKLASNMEKFLKEPIVSIIPGQSFVACGKPIPGGRIPYDYKLADGSEISGKTVIKQTA